MKKGTQNFYFAPVLKKIFHEMFTVYNNNDVFSSYSLDNQMNEAYVPFYIKKIKKNADVDDGSEKKRKKI